MHESDLHLEPNEASDLAPVFEPEVLRERGWDLAFVTVLDEAHAENALAVLTHSDGAAPDEGWEARRLEAKASSAAGKTEDAEACARRDGRVREPAAARGTTRISTRTRVARCELVLV